MSLITELCSGFIISKIYDLTARWLEKLAAFEYKIVHRSGKRIGHADSMSRIPSQNAITDQANIPTRGAEAKHPTQNNDEASDTE